MIRFVDGDLFEQYAEAIVNPVNCVGVSGKGLAKKFKIAFPDNYKFYRKECEDGNLFPGGIASYKRNTMFNPKWIYNFATKKHWKDDSKLRHIDYGLTIMADHSRHYNVKSIAMPMVGAGLGNLDEEDVMAKIFNSAHMFEHTDLIVVRYKNG